MLVAGGAWGVVGGDIWGRGASGQCIQEEGSSGHKVSLSKEEEGFSLFGNGRDTRKTATRKNFVCPARMWSLFYNL